MRFTLSWARRVLLSSLCASAPCFAGDGMTCDRLEYARLKDSTRSELSQEYCSAMAGRKYNVDLLAMKQQAGMLSVKDMEQLHAAELSCLKAADDAAGMLAKKFRGAKPTCM